MEYGYNVAEEISSIVDRAETLSGRRLNYAELRELKEALVRGDYNYENIGVAFSLILDNYLLARKTRLDPDKYDSWDYLALEEKIKREIINNTHPEVVAQFVDIMRSKIDFMNGQQVVILSATLLINSLKKYLRTRNYELVLQDKDKLMEFNKLLDVYVILNEVRSLANFQLHYNSKNEY